MICAVTLGIAVVVMAGYWFAIRPARIDAFCIKLAASRTLGYDSTYSEEVAIFNELYSTCVADRSSNIYLPSL